MLGSGCRRSILSFASGGGSGAAPALDLNFTLGVNDPRITFSGGANRTRFNSAGLLVAATTPRFDYDPVLHFGRGLLVEEARTNEALWSRDLTNAAWVKTTATAALDQVGIDGAANAASSLLATAGNALCLQVITEAAVVREFSAYVKRITGTGTIQLTEDGGSTFTDVTAQINSSTYTRVIAASQSVLNPSVGFRIVTNGDKIAVDVCQNEAGAFATSPIITTAASVAATADSAVMTGANFSSWYNQAAGTFLVSADLVLPAMGTAQCLVRTDDNTTNNAFVLQSNAGTGNAGGITGSAGVFDGSVTSVSPLVSNTVFRVVLAYAANDLNLSLNGAAVVNDNAYTFPLAQTRLDIGANHVGSVHIGSGHIQYIKYWNTRLTNAKLQAYTA